MAGVPDYGCSKIGGRSCRELRWPLRGAGDQPKISRIVVDFPDPFGPRKPVTTRTSKVTASAATFD
jgi:hypothetical protein